MRKKLSCVNCGQSYWAHSPSDKFTQATLEPCELEDYDLIQNVDCDHCSHLHTVYWHNPELERKRLLELKELSYLKERYFGYNMGAIAVASVFLAQGLRDIKASIKGEPQSVVSDHIFNVKCQEWLGEFRKTRMDSVEVTPSQRRKFDREMGERSKRFADDFFAYASKRLREWLPSEEGKAFALRFKDHPDVLKAQAKKPEIEQPRGA